MFKLPDDHLASSAESVGQHAKGRSRAHSSFADHGGEAAFGWQSVLHSPAKILDLGSREKCFEWEFRGERVPLQSEKSEELLEQIHGATSWSSSSSSTLALGTGMYAGGSPVAAYSAISFRSKGAMPGLRSATSGSEASSEPTGGSRNARCPLAFLTL